MRGTRSSGQGRSSPAKAYVTPRSVKARAIWSARNLSSLGSIGCSAASTGS